MNLNNIYIYIYIQLYTCTYYLKKTNKKNNIYIYCIYIYIFRDLWSVEIWYLGFGSKFCHSGSCSLFSHVLYVFPLLPWCAKNQTFERRLCHNCVAVVGRVTIAMVDFAVSSSLSFCLAGWQVPNANCNSHQDLNFWLVNVISNAPSYI